MKRGACSATITLGGASVVQYEMSLKPSSSFGHDGGMKAIMKLEDLRTIDPLSEFLSGTQAVVFSIMTRIFGFRLGLSASATTVAFGGLHLLV